MKTINKTLFDNKRYLVKRKWLNNIILVDTDTCQKCVRHCIGHNVLSWMQPSN